MLIIRAASRSRYRLLSVFSAVTLAQPLGQWGNLSPLFADFLPRLLQAIFVLVLTLYLTQRSRSAFLKASSRSKADVNSRYLVARLLSLAVLFIGLATILAIFEVPLTAVVTFIGVVGLAVSLAMQDILKNFFAGLYLLFERPFRIGDSIRVRDFSGTVEDIGVRTTTLRTAENVQVLIPNAIVFAEVVLNRTFAREEQTPSPAGPAATPASAPQSATEAAPPSAARTNAADTGAPPQPGQDHE